MELVIVWMEKKLCVRIDFIDREENFLLRDLMCEIYDRILGNFYVWFKWGFFKLEIYVYILVF